MTTPAIQFLPPVMATAEAAIRRCPVATVETHMHSHQLVDVQIGREQRIRGAYSGSLESHGGDVLTIRRDDADVPADPCDTRIIVAKQYQGRQILTGV